MQGEETRQRTAAARTLKLRLTLRSGRLLYWSRGRTVRAKGCTLEPLPDLGSLSDADLKAADRRPAEEEQEVSYRRRLLHGKIDILRAELVVAAAAVGGQSVLAVDSRLDVDPRRQGDAEILDREGGRRRRTWRRASPMSHVYCPECGFQNPEAANYCSRCGALLVKDERRPRRR